MKGKQSAHGLCPEGEMTVRSKAYVQPTLKRRIMVRITNVCAVLAVILAVISVPLNGFKLQSLLGFGLMALILSGYSRLENSRPHYEWYLANLRFGENMLTIRYLTQGKMEPPPSPEIIYRDLQTVEYSAQLCCFKLSCCREQKGASNGSSHLLYMENISAPEFVSRIERAAGIRVFFREQPMRQENQEYGKI